MAEDIVKRLRGAGDGFVQAPRYEAANEIERMRDDLRQCEDWLRYLTRGLSSPTADKIKAWLEKRALSSGGKGLISDH